MSGASPAAPITRAVVEAARHGDRDAIAEIYRALAPAVLGYLRGTGVPDPENVAGDVFVGVIRGLPRFAGDGEALRTWTFTIAHRRVADDRRRRRRRPEAPVDDNVLRLPGPDEFDAMLSGVSAAPVRDALAALTPDQRSVVLLRVVADLSLAQTAGVLHKPVAAVKMLQRRALDALARTLRAQPVT